MPTRERRIKEMLRDLRRDTFKSHEAKFHRTFIKLIERELRKTTDRNPSGVSY